MLDETLSIPLYRQLKQELYAKIKSGEWAPGSKIPSEDELGKYYEISRMTVRLAMNELHNEGYLYRKQGKGTFVRVPRIEQKLGAFYSFSDDIVRMGYQVKSDVLDFSVIKASELIAQKLNVSKDADVYEIKRLRYVNEMYFAYETSYILCNLCPGITRESVLKIGLYNTIQELSSIRPDTATEAFESIVIGGVYAELLKTRKNTPGFHILRVTNSGGVAFEYCESYVRGDILTYNVVLRKDPLG